MNLVIAIGVIALLIWALITWYIFQQSTLAKRQTLEEAREMLVRRFGNSEYLKYLEDAVTLQIVSDEGLKLQGYLFESPNPSSRVVIISHGYTGNHYITLPFVPVYWSMGFHVLLIEMRGHGMSEGKRASYGYYESQDLGCWVDKMKLYYGERVKVALHGQSMGAAASLIYIESHWDIQFVVADCSYSDSEELLGHQIQTVGNLPPALFVPALKQLMVRQAGYNLAEASPIRSSEHSPVPIMFVHGDQDEIIPYHMSQEMYDVRNHPKDKLLIIKGAKHVEAYPVAPEQYVQALQEFIACSWA
ncbi:MAG: alpha/beta hydrolase [Cellulosilyticaceae bacterium]